MRATSHSTLTALLLLVADILGMCALAYRLGADMAAIWLLWLLYGSYVVDDMDVCYVVTHALPLFCLLGLGV